MIKNYFFVSENISDIMETNLIGNLSNKLQIIVNNDKQGEKITIYYFQIYILFIFYRFNGGC